LTAQVRRFPYSVFYSVESEQIVVLAVFHARRDPAIWKGRA
jgi:plasmid stabilization system protein ParE